MESLWKINQRIKAWEKEHKKEIKTVKIESIEDERMKIMKELGH